MWDLHDLHDLDRDLPHAGKLGSHRPCLRVLSGLLDGCRVAADLLARLQAVPYQPPSRDPVCVVLRSKQFKCVRFVQCVQEAAFIGCSETEVRCDDNG